MKLNLKNDIVFFDLETTGVDIVRDKIIEISLLKVCTNGNEISKTMRINPGRPIPPESTAIHHITDEDVATCPQFKEVAKEIAKFIEGCDLAGYNSNRFDIPMLAEELTKADVDFDFSKRKFVDVQVIFHKMEQRTLSAAYKFYCGKSLEHAHSADADTMATYEILKAQLDHYEELSNDINELSKFSTQQKHADFAGFLAYNNNNEITLNFGKNKGKTVSEILKTQSQYIDWIINNDFPAYTKKILTNIKLQESNLLK